MEYQNLAFSPTQQTNNSGKVGDGFWYIDATAADGVNTKIAVTPNGGSAIIVKPGQHFRMEQDVAGWAIASVDSAATFTGNIVIGSGDFGDSNISNTFKLDGTFTNSVKVTNTTAERVPVTLDVTQTQPVSVAGTVPTKNRSTYTNSAATTSTAATLVTAAANVNGVIIEAAAIVATANGTGSSYGGIFAKTGAAPSSMTDGDVILAYAVYSPTGTTPTNTDVAVGNAIFVPAGKAIYAAEFGAAPTYLFKNMLYTLL